MCALVSECSRVCCCLPLVVTRTACLSRLLASVDVRYFALACRSRQAQAGPGRPIKMVAFVQLCCDEGGSESPTIIIRVIMTGGREREGELRKWERVSFSARVRVSERLACLATRGLRLFNRKRKEKKRKKRSGKRARSDGRERGGKPESEQFVDGGSWVGVVPRCSRAFGLSLSLSLFPDVYIQSYLYPLFSVWQDSFISLAFCPRPRPRPRPCPRYLIYKGLQVRAGSRFRQSLCKHRGIQA